MPSSFKNQTINNKEKTMKKVLLALLSIALAFTAMQPSQAQDQKVLAIIDTAIDSKQFPQIIHEVCFNTHTSTCPNGSKFMEGTGAANLSVWPKPNVSGAWHGDWMVKGALKADPTVKIVFIRYVEVTGSNTYRNDGLSLVNAIDWVAKNAEKYSIDALSISQSNINTPSWCAGNKTTVDAVASLNTKNVPVFAATGNNARADIVGFPSCVSGVIGVGALLPNKVGFEKNTNGQSKINPGIDIATFGAVEIHMGNNLNAKFNLAGSSGATVASAATYLKNNSYKTFQEYFNALSKIVINTVSYSSN
jgi:hypothetical protein